MTRAAGVTPRSRPFAVAATVTLVLILLSAAIAVGWRTRMQDEGRETFAVDATRAEQQVVERLQSATEVLLAARAEVQGEEAVTSDSFQAAVAAVLPGDLTSLQSVAVVERMDEADLAGFEARHQAAGLTDFKVLDVDPGGPPAAVATFEASSRAGAPILSGYDLRSVPALAQAFAADESSRVRLAPRLERLPRNVVRLYRELASGFALVAPAGDGKWVVGLLSGDQLAEEATGVDDELDVAIAVDGDQVGSSARRAGGVIDLQRVPREARTTMSRDIEGGPLQVTVADLNGLAGGGWREPGLLLGAGIALSILVGSLILVLARGRAGALRVASEAEQARDRSEENFRAIVQHLSDLVVITDAEMDVLFVTPSVAQLLGRDASTITGQRLTAYVHPDDRGLLANVADRPGVSDKRLVRFRHSEGSHRYFEVVVSNRLEDPAIHGLVLTAHDVTDRVKLEDRLAHDATHDALTGLPNRTLIKDRLQVALARAERSGKKVAVIFGDLDGFKAINDDHGHLVGDDLLVAVANRLRSAARTAETVGRYAGDEFVVICEDLEDDAGARLAAERLHREVARLVDLDGILVDVTMSVGVAVADRQETIEGLLERADRAMYQAKPPRPPASTADA
jgi:diguanylate cyclase (GGDEF)-like protein/PAS domain S-box-containing protein